MFDLRRTLHPAWYQGHRTSPPYFEGWYFKLIDADKRNRYAVIPGIYRSSDGEDSHCFVQILDGAARRAIYRRYPVGEFWAAEDAFEVHVGPSRFTAERVDLDVDSPELALSGELTFHHLTPWPVTWLSPGVMGWYAWVPFMETYHGVVSLDHTIEGALTIDGMRVDFSGGRGYIEKDWGRAFPSAWVWMQSNHFDHEGTSLTGSVATIPWLFASFRGFIFGLWHDGMLHRFTTYTGARIEKLQIEEERVLLDLRDGRRRLHIVARRAETGMLRGPIQRGGMRGRVPETLQATLEVRLSELDGDREAVIFEGSGRNAGLEVGGEWEKLL